MARYGKAVSTALWLQLALAVYYVPKFTMLIVINHSKTYSSRVVVIDVIASILVYFNSTLNPFLYCWRIREVKQAVKERIRRALCFPSTQIYFLGVVRLLQIRRNLKGKKKEDRIIQTRLFSIFGVEDPLVFAYLG